MWGFEGDGNRVHDGSRPDDLGGFDALGAVMRERWAPRVEMKHRGP